MNVQGQLLGLPSSSTSFAHPSTFNGLHPTPPINTNDPPALDGQFDFLASSVKSEQQQLPQQPPQQQPQPMTAAASFNLCWYNPWQPQQMCQWAAAAASGRYGGIGTNALLNPIATSPSSVPIATAFPTVAANQIASTSSNGTANLFGQHYPMAAASNFGCSFNPYTNNNNNNNIPQLALYHPSAASSIEVNQQFQHLLNPTATAFMANQNQQKFEAEADGEKLAIGNGIHNGIDNAGIMMASAGMANANLASAPISRLHPRHQFGPGTNNLRVRTKDQYRIVYTECQRMELEREFAKQQFINSERKATLSERLHLTERQIKIWFQNRRAKQRKGEKQLKLTHHHHHHNAHQNPHHQNHHHSLVTHQYTHPHPHPLHHPSTRHNQHQMNNSLF